jgi:hypothetical protein
VVESGTMIHNNVRYKQLKLFGYSPSGELICKKVYMRLCEYGKCNRLAKYPCKYCNMHLSLIELVNERGW